MAAKYPHISLETDEDSSPVLDVCPPGNLKNVEIVSNDDDCFIVPRHKNTHFHENDMPEIVPRHKQYDKFNKNNKHDKHDKHDKHNKHEKNDHHKHHMDKYPHISHHLKRIDNEMYQDISNPKKRHAVVPEDESDDEDARSNVSNVSDVSNESSMSGSASSGGSDTGSESGDSVSSGSSEGSHHHHHHHKSKEDILTEKQNYLYKLWRLEQRGAKLSHHYNIKSKLDHIRAEYERLNRQYAVQDSTRFMRQTLMTFVSGIEWLNLV